jgi:pSer/pThr/pTyr-binding forkhead associated (FHA) protein
MQITKQLEFTFLSGPEEGRTYTFKAKSITIGSGRGSDLLIKDRSINAEHAVVTIEESGVVIQNRAVTGATFVNGQRVDRALLENEDQIAFGGGMALKFHATDVSEGFQAPFRTPAAPSFRLQVVAGLLRGMSYEYTREQVILGSRRGCELLMSDVGVEPEHARVVAEASELVLYNSAQAGTKVNGKAVERQVLHNGDKIEIGPVHMTFQEILGDVRLAKPRRGAGDGGPLQRTGKTPGSIFRNPVVIAGLLVYFWGFIFVLIYIATHRSEDKELPFGGGFGFHSVARGIYIAKSIGQDLYDKPLQMVGRPDQEGDWAVRSGDRVLCSSRETSPFPLNSDIRKQVEKKWPDSPKFRRLLISDAAEATRCLSMAREKYLNRNLSPAALFFSIQYFRRAEAYCPEADVNTRSAIREEMIRAEIDLMEFYEDIWERAYIKRRCKNYSGAAELYEFLLKLIPDDRNPGNLYARNAELECIGKS